MAIRRVSNSGLTGVRYNVTQAGNTPIADIPDAPTIGAVTAGIGQATVAFTPATRGGVAASYTVTSTPSGITATGASSPILVTGLTNGTEYTFKVKANNASGSGAESAASNAATPQAIIATGGAVTTIGGFRYHAFTANGTFDVSNVPAGATMEIFVLAGGGGAWNSNGAAGAGGAMHHPAFSPSVTSYPITVGAGGAANTQGSDSQFSSLFKALGGGRSGYSGGCGGGNFATSGTGPAATQTSGGGATGYGNRGGIGHPQDANGGGGGIGTAGSNAGAYSGGQGGSGLDTWSAWGAATGKGHNVGGVYYFGGGGGGYPNGGGGNGGGGSARNSGFNTGNDGLQNTGGGGGAGYFGFQYGANGGSGIVIIRYPY